MALADVAVVRALLLVLVAGCDLTDGADLLIDANQPGPIGVGLTATYDVQAWYGDESPYPITPQVRVDDTGIVVDAPAMPGMALTGIAEGRTDVALRDPDPQSPNAEATITVETSPVASTRLFYHPTYDGPDLEFPLKVFASSHFLVSQASTGPNGPVAGAAPLALDAGATAVVRDGANAMTFDTGATLGAAALSALATTVTFEVVDGSAITDFALAGSTSSAFALCSEACGVSLRAVAGDQPIIGAGPEPTFTIADPLLLAITQEVFDDDSREIVFRSNAHAGSTTVDMVWGAAHKTLTVTVTF